MHPRVLRELADVIVRPLTTIFNQSRKLGELLKDWRLEIVTPIFKKGKQKD